jgi:exosortase K
MIVHKNRNIPYYLSVVGLFALLKLGYTFADNDGLAFLMKPIDKLVGLMTGSVSIYHSETGYYHQTLQIVIDKSCSGFNFWVLSFLLLAYLALKYFDKPLHKIMTIPFSLVMAYLLTIAVSAARIFISIIVQNQANHLLPERPHLILHEMVGIATNLTFLLLAYLLFEKILIKIQRYEKLT